MILNMYIYKWINSSYLHTSFHIIQILIEAICYIDPWFEAVLEFIKEGRGENFSEEDIEIVNSYLVWGAVGIHYSNHYAKIQHQEFVNEFLLSVVK